MFFMKKIVKLLCMALLAGTFTACDLLDIHPYAVKINGERDINATNIKEIETSCRDKDSIRFVVTGDSQRWYDETEDFVKAVNSRNDIDFVIHGGDVSDFGMTDEFEWQRDILNGLDVPYIVIIGNHDCIGNGKRTFKKIFGQLNFSFIANRVKFICLNTNSMEFDYSEPIPDFTFIEDELTNRQTEFDKTVFCMHARPLSEQFNNNDAKPFEYYVNLFPKVQFCTAAHDHRITAEAIFKDGVMYYGSDCMMNRNYLLFTIKADGYEYEVVPF